MKTNTEILIPVPELKSIAPGINKIISRRSTLPVLGCVRFTTDIEGKVRMQATDLEDIATVTLEKAEPKSIGDFLVPWDSLSKAIKNCTPSDNIVLVDNGKDGVVLRTFLAGRQIEQKLEAREITEWPPIPEVKEPGIVVDGTLRQALQEAFELSSDDPSRYTINSAYLDVADKNAHYVVSTNGRALFSANSFKFDLKQSLIVPHRKFLGWAPFWEGAECQLAFQPGEEHPTTKVRQTGWVQFKTGRWTFITKEIEGTYPNWKQVVPTATPSTIIKLTQEVMEQMLQFLPKLPGTDLENKPVSLVVANNHLQIQAKGKADEKPIVIPVDGTLITGNSVSISVNREYMIRALRFGLGDISIFDPLSPLLFQSQGKRMVVMPLRPDAPQPPSPASEPASTPTASSTQTHEQNPNNNERPEMPKAAASSSNTTASTTTSQEPASESAIKSVIQQVEKIKDSLKEVLHDLTDVLTGLKAAEKEKKATEKEIESIRATLKTIQNVKI